MPDDDRITRIQAAQIADPLMLAQLWGLLGSAQQDPAVFVANFRRQALDAADAMPLAPEWAPDVNDLRSRVKAELAGHFDGVLWNIQGTRAPRQ